MIGNDVVDLSLAKLQSNWRRKGFLDKVFSPSEKYFIAESERPDLLVWLFWSMKEAAYKAHQRRFLLPRKLNWQQQDCELSDFTHTSATGLVTNGGHDYYSFSEISSSAIHTSVVISKNSSVRSCFLRGPSESARALLIQAAANHLDRPVGFFSIEKDQDGIPFIRYEKKRLSTGISLSSHGKYSAFSLSLMNC